MVDPLDLHGTTVDVDEAKADHDTERATRARAEVDSLTEELAGAFGLG